jgi:LysR family cyn operon transcriptional activator
MPLCIGIRQPDAQLTGNVGLRQLFSFWPHRNELLSLEGGFMDVVPPLRKLQYVLAVARDLHFRKAAERLHVSQPSISRQIREYEDEIGFQILQRDHHFVSLTKAGRSFVSDVEQMFVHIEDDFIKAVRRALAISQESSSGYILAHSPFASLRIRRIALNLRREVFRNFSLRLRILPTSELLTAIECDVVHAGITFAPVDHPGIAAIPIGGDHWVAVVPSNSRFANVRIARIGELRGLPVISNGSDRTHRALFRQFASECAAKGFPFKTIAEVTSPHEAFDLVKEDAGVVLLPAGLCEVLPRGVRAIRIADISPLETVLVHRADASEFTLQFAARIRAEMNLQFVGKDGEHSEETPATAERKPPASTLKSKRETLSNRPAI